VAAVFAPGTLVLATIGVLGIVAGFSAMMGRDEERTVELVLEFHELVRSGIERHGGRVVGTAGDSVFGDFDSIVEAMDLATELQAELHARNASVPEGERLAARIGLHLGDVVVEELNVFGDGVNIAARLEEMADPGGILVSEAVYQQVKQHVDVPFEDVGIKQLKNIDQPIKVYRVAPESFGRADTRSPVPASSDDPDDGRSLDALRASKDEARAEYQAMAREQAAAGIREALDDRRRRHDRRSRRRARRRHRNRKDPVAAVFAPGTLVLATIGVLGIVAGTSGWTDNGIYPFLGSAFLGLALGVLVADLSGLTGMRKVLLGLAVGVGAFSLGGVVWRSLSLVAGAAVLGAGIRDVRAGR
jgi:hypothetical protein